MRAQIKARGAVYALLSACIPGSGVSFLTYYHTLMKRDGIESESLHPPPSESQLLVPRNGNESTENGWLGSDLPPTRKGCRV
jgi:hypothetical protein